jgi:hypothetical protein
VSTHDPDGETPVFDHLDDDDWPNDQDFEYDRDPDFPDDDPSEFADPGGNSALRAATPTNPRNLPCPTCGAENVLTPRDRMHGYQCDACADQAERGF